MSKKIGFVGLGTMGFPMAVNLTEAGFEVIGYDAFTSVYEKANAAGITTVNTLKEVAKQADEAIISMVCDYAQNVDVIFGENGLVADTALAVLLKDLKATFVEGIKHNIPLPFNALSCTQLFHSMEKKTPAPIIELLLH